VSMDSVDLSSPLLVRRSQRNGHDRAYVRAGNRDVGYRDLVSGDIRCKQAKHRDAVAEATAKMWDQAQAEMLTAYKPRHAAPEDAVPVPV